MVWRDLKLLFLEKVCSCVPEWGKAHTSMLCVAHFLLATRNNCAKVSQRQMARCESWRSSTTSEGQLRMVWTCAWYRKDQLCGSKVDSQLIPSFLHIFIFHTDTQKISNHSSMMSFFFFFPHSQGILTKERLKLRSVIHLHLLPLVLVAVKIEIWQTM